MRLNELFSKDCASTRWIWRDSKDKMIFQDGFGLWYFFPFVWKEQQQQPCFQVAFSSSFPRTATTKAVILMPPQLFEKMMVVKLLCGCCVTEEHSAKLLSSCSLPWEMAQFFREDSKAQGFKHATLFFRPIWKFDITRWLRFTVVLKHSRWWFKALFTTRVTRTLSLQVEEDHSAWKSPKMSHLYGYVTLCIRVMSHIHWYVTLLGIYHTLRSMSHFQGYVTLSGICHIFRSMSHLLRGRWFESAILNGMVWFSNTVQEEVLLNIFKNSIKGRAAAASRKEGPHKASYSIFSSALKVAFCAHDNHPSLALPAKHGS